MSELIVCTLFEGHYHYGVAALVNSLYANGFRGHIYVGFKGELPSWTKEAKKTDDIRWKDATYLNITEGLGIYFIPVEAAIHFTNYKPQFALDLVNLLPNARAVFYFDPDIVVKCTWRFFEKWIHYGIALVHEITNHDMPPTHPVRKGWEEIIVSKGHLVTNTPHSYINAGFFGVKRQDKNFLELYIQFVSVSINEHSADLSQLKFGGDRTELFYARDQDALNIAAMCCSAPLSEYGPEGMDFIHGGKLLSHAIGRPKPWKKKYVFQALKANSPTLSDSAYWNYAVGVITLYNSTYLSYKRTTLKIASFIGRFYNKN